MAIDHGLLTAMQPAVASLGELFEPEFARRALVAILIVTALAGALGPSIVLRDLPFFTHAAGAGAYPVLVVGAPLGVSTAFAGIVGAPLFAVALWLVSRRAATSRLRDAYTGLLVAVALAGGAVLAELTTAEARLGQSPEALLFGSVLAIDWAAIAASAVPAGLALVSACALSLRWLAAGFDREAAGALGVARYDAALLAAVALAVAATITLTGALMAGALLVAPAATARVLAAKRPAITALTVVVALADGVAGLCLSLAYDLPAGATIAAVAGSAFALAAASRAALDRASRSRAHVWPAIAALPLLFALALAGCGAGAASDRARATRELPLVLATTSPVADIVRHIGADAVRVKTLLPVGTDPHRFEPKPSDLRSLGEARVIFRSGGAVDAWLQPAIDSAGGGRRPIDLSNAAVLLPANGGTSPLADRSNADELSFNSHWYLDPTNVAAAATLVRDELIKAHPEARETYRANAAAYAGLLRRLDAALRACALRVPPKRRVVVTDHDEFDYLARRYGLTIASRLRGSGTGEPSLRDVQSAVDGARRRGARAVLTGRQAGGSLAATVASRLRVPLLKLYVDALAPSGAAATVDGAIRHDTTQILRSVSGSQAQCQIPSR